MSRRRPFDPFGWARWVTVAAEVSRRHPDARVSLAADELRAAARPLGGRRPKWKHYLTVEYEARTGVRRMTSLPMDEFEACAQLAEHRAFGRKAFVTAVAA